MRESGVAILVRYSEREALYLTLAERTVDLQLGERGRRWLECKYGRIGNMTGDEQGEESNVSAYVNDAGIRVQANAMLKITTLLENFVEEITPLGKR